MTDNEQMLTELIELAQTNGWQPQFGSSDLFISRNSYNMPEFGVVTIGSRVTFSGVELLFDHDFARAVFGEPEIELSGVYDSGWHIHLMQLAITPEKDRIKYAYENRVKDLHG